MRWRSRVKPARPYICRLIIFVLVFTPSVRPLWNGRVTAAMTACWSRSRPRVKACRCGRSLARAVRDQSVSAASLPGAGWSRAAKETDEGGEGGHLRAGCRQLAEQWLLAVAERGGPGEQEPGDSPW
jgi:hypothetical protein